MLEGGPGFGELGRWSVFAAEPRLEFEATLGAGVADPPRGPGPGGIEAAADPLDGRSRDSIDPA